MFRQPALAGSALEGLHDELLAYLTLFSSPEDLLALANVNSVFYVFSREEPLWMLHCLRLHGGDFTFHRSWRLTTFFPRPQLAPKAMPEQLPALSVRNFGSDFLYRRWCRSHMSLRDFEPPSPDNDPFVRRIHTFDVRDLSYQAFYDWITESSWGFPLLGPMVTRQYACVPFILKNAITKWKAARDWTMPQLAARFADPSIRHRLTHNLDTTSEKDTQMTFRDYHAYLTQQRHDETPLYIFDPRFGEKMPSLLRDYDVSDLRVFREDLLQLVADTNDPPAATASEPGPKPKMPASIRPDFRWIVMGPERSGAPWHTDPARTSAWNALVKGRKRWAIYPPGSPPPGISVGKNAQGREHALNMTSLYWYLHVYPTLLPHQRPLEVVQEEGDVIYVPSGWWHLVLNLDEALAVTQNFVDSHNLLAFVNDLLDDQQHEALQIFQHAIKQSPRKEISDVCRLVQIPRLHGYLKSELYVASFRNTRSWKTPVKSVLKHHKLSYEQLRQRGPLANLTARVNPTFAIGNELLIKFYSELNQDWGEFDLTTYLSPDFQESENQNKRNKKRKTVVLSPHELKTRMTLRFAMEECFRIEKATYQMIQQSEELPLLQRMVPRLHHAGHLLDVSEVDDEDGDGLMWRWPYTIMEFKRGLVGISSLVKRGGGGATMASWQRLATWLNDAFLPKFHAVAIDQQLCGLRGHSKATWEWYEHYLLHQRKRALAFHLKEDAIPPQLINWLESFLFPATADAVADHLLPARSSPTRVKPVLLHGDLTDENVLGTLSEQPPQEELSDLATWLRSKGFAKYVPLLVDQHELTISSMELLTESHLKELGVPLGPRLELLQAIVARMQSSSSSSATCVHNGNFSDSDSDSDDDDDDGEDDGDDGIRDYVAGPAELEALQATRLRKFYGTTGVATDAKSSAREWTPTQVIDFADAKTGDPLFDLVAMFFSALHCDRKLWRMALETHYWQQYLHHEMAALQLDAAATARVVRERFLRLTLLHPSRSIKSLFHFYPQTLRLMSWQQVAEVVFGDLFAPQ